MDSWEEYYRKLEEIKKSRKRIVFKSSSRNEAEGTITIIIETSDGDKYVFTLREKLLADPDKMIEYSGTTINDHEPIDLRVYSNYLIEIFEFLRIRRPIEINNISDVYNFLKILKALEKTMNNFLEDAKQMLANSILRKSLQDPKFLDLIDKLLEEAKSEGLL